MNMNNAIHLAKPDIRKKTANQLNSATQFQFNTKKPFTLRSGKKAPLYCDARSLLGNTTARRKITDALYNLTIEKIKPIQTLNAVVGVATAGIPQGILLAERLNLPFGYVRASKEHGLKKTIEGLDKLAPQASVIVVEDVVSSGGSALEAVEALRKAGYKVQGIIAILSYQSQQQQTALQEAEIPLYALAGRKDLYDAIEKDQNQNPKQTPKDLKKIREFLFEEA